MEKLKYLLKQKKLEMLNTLEYLVNIDSGSHDKEGIDRIGSFLKEKYEQLNFTVDVRQQENYGNHLIVQHKESVEPTIIILAHMDTVFPKGTVGRRPFTNDGTRAFGPGVIDMKGSLVTLLYAISALKGVEDIESLRNKKV
jgi:glutamate carboxypeptidase